METPRRSTTGTRTIINLHDLDDMQSVQHRYSSVGSRSINQDYQYQEPRIVRQRETSKSTCCGCCSKLCLIGLGIGLAMGILIAAAVAVPLAVINRTSSSTVSTRANWLGTYQMDSACDTTACCCLSNQMTMSQVINNQIQMASSVTGRCTNLASNVTLTQLMPNGYQMYFTWFGERIRLQLSQDSSYISLVNIDYPFCSAGALKTSSSAGRMVHMNLGFISFVLLSDLGIIINHRT